MHVAPGLVLSGTLRLIRRLADGGMGSVWVAEHVVLGIEVAVKVLSGPWADAADAPARFLREAMLTARIDSPHVVRVLDCRFTEADEPYLVLELLHGQTLEERVRRSGPLSLRDLAWVIAQTCEALAATHRAGVVHRDLKPENVFLVAGPREAVKLIDFGVAKPKAPAEWAPADRLAAGTPQYMSPEQFFTPEQADERADLFSLGCVAYFALTGRPPFGGARAARAGGDAGGPRMRDALAGAFRPPSIERRDVPKAVDEWLSRALAPAPATRFLDARAMADALAAALRPPAVDVEPARARARALGAFAAFGVVASVFVLAAELVVRMPRLGHPAGASPAPRSDVALRGEKAQYSQTSPPPEVGSFRARR
jgi:serine/threonine-protein kinase